MSAKMDQHDKATEEEVKARAGRLAALAAKEARGRDGLDPRADRPERPEPEVLPVDDTDKTAWKEARNQHPASAYQERQRDPAPEPVEAEEPRPRTREEILAKQDRARSHRA